MIFSTNFSSEVYMDDVFEVCDEYYFPLQEGSKVNHWVESSSFG